MKKVVMLILCLGLFLCSNTVFAKDIAYSLNKYQEEELNYILKDPTGFVMAGTFEKKDNDVQIMMIKYLDDGRIEWKYSFGESHEDKIYGLTYLYDDTHNINGYVMVVEDSTNQDIETNPQFLVIDLEGKFIKKQDSLLSTNTFIKKIEIVEGGYLLVGEENEQGFIAKYDKELNFIWKKSDDIYQSIITDIRYVSPTAYYVIISNKVDEKDQFYLYKYNEELDSFSIIKDDFESGFEPHLEKGINSYYVYGITSDVKLSNNQVGSYYIIKYNLEDNEEWETVGNTSIDDSKVLKLQVYEKQDSIEYYILSVNREDNSYEVIRANQDGNLEEKIKKLKNDYYDIHDFLFVDNSLYFVGQMSCPDTDNCDYKAKSLFLACTEDKVIEVKPYDIKYILIGVILVASFMVGVYYIRRKKILVEKEH